jgi:S1-C subfamily serine protease
LVLGDVLVAIDDRPVKTTQDLLDALERAKVGQTVMVTVRRDGEEVNVPVTLEATR